METNFKIDVDYVLQIVVSAWNDGNLHGSLQIGQELGLAEAEVIEYVQQHGGRDIVQLERTLEEEYVTKMFGTRAELANLHEVKHTSTNKERKEEIESIKDLIAKYKQDISYIRKQLSIIYRLRGKDEYDYPDDKVPIALSENQLQVAHDLAYDLFLGYKINRGSL